MILGKALEKPSLMVFSNEHKFGKVDVSYLNLSQTFPKLRFGPIFQKNPSLEYFWENVKENPDLCEKNFLCSWVGLQGATWAGLQGS